MSSKNKNRGANRGGRQPKPFSKPSRKERQRVHEWEARLDQQGPAYKNVQRRSIVRKTGITRSEKKILDKLESTVHKVGEILDIMLDKEKRAKKRNLEEKSGSLSRSMGKKVGKALWDNGGALALAGLGVAGVLAGAGEETIYGEDEANGPRNDVGETGVWNKGGIQDFDGAKIAFKNKSVRIDGISKNFWKRFVGAVREYQQKFGGGPVQINDGYRTHEDQKRMYSDPGMHAAAPGYSMHEYGFALDMNTGDANRMDRLGLFKKWGLGRPDLKAGKDKTMETWHIEDMNKEVQEAKKNMWASSRAGKTLEAKNYMAALDELTSTAEMKVDEGASTTPLTERDLVAALKAGEITQFQFEYMKDVFGQLAAAERAKSNEEILAAKANLGNLYSAEGALLNVVAGEAGPELVLPMNDRGSSVLAEAIRQAFGELMAESARSKKDKMRMERMRAFFSETFIPKLKSELGS